MNYLTIYLGITGLVMMRAGWLNRDDARSYEDFCTLFGMCVLWPVTFVVEARNCWLQSKRRGSSEAEIRARIRQNRGEP